MKFPPLALALLALALAVQWCTNAAAQLPQAPQVAIEGYDPVAYFTEQRPVEGSPQHIYDWDGLRYQFASAANRDRFAADPYRFAPHYSGFCAATLALRGTQVAANPKYWLIIDDKLYLFGGPKGPEIFAKNPSLVRQAEANWAPAKTPKN